MQNLSSKAWLSGLSDLADAIGDPDRYGQQFVTNVMPLFTSPALMSQATPTVDPYAREARSILERVQSRIPFASRSLPLRRDILGQPMRSEGGVGPDMATPIWTTTDRRNPIINDLLANNMRISRPSRSVGKDGEMTPQQYSDYQATVGRVALPKLRDLTRDPAWRGLEREAQQDELDRLMKQSRATAKRLTGMFGNLR